MISLQSIWILLFGSNEEICTGSQTAECSTSPVMYLRPIKVERPVRQAFMSCQSLRESALPTSLRFFQYFHMFCEIKEWHFKYTSAHSGSKSCINELLRSTCVGEDLEVALRRQLETNKRTRWCTRCSQQTKTTLQILLLPNRTSGLLRVWEREAEKQKVILICSLCIWVNAKGTLPAVGCYEYELKKKLFKAAQKCHICAHSWQIYFMCEPRSQKKWMWGEYWRKMTSQLCRNFNIPQ